MDFFRAISNRILNEYRLNPDRYNQLQRHIQEQKKQKHQARPPLPFSSVSAVLEVNRKHLILYILPLTP